MVGACGRVTCTGHASCSGRFADGDGVAVSVDASADVIARCKSVGGTAVGAAGISGADSALSSFLS